MSFSRFKEIMNSLQRVSSVCQIILFKKREGSRVLYSPGLILFPCALARGDGVMSENLSKFRGVLLFKRAGPLIRQLLGQG